MAGWLDGACAKEVGGSATPRTGGLSSVLTARHDVVSKLLVTLQINGGFLDIVTTLYM